MQGQLFPKQLLRPGGFTLLEMLVAAAVTAILLVVLLGLISMTSRLSQGTVGKLSQFDAARTGFETIGRIVRQAVLNPYIGYDDPTHPTRYERQSELQFISGPNSAFGIPKAGSYDGHAIFCQVPVGLTEDAQLQSANSLLCTVGFYLVYGEEPHRPSALGDLTSKRTRYRLMYYIEPTERLSLYTNTLVRSQSPIKRNPNYVGTDWIRAVSDSPYSHVLAENVVAFVILPIFDGQPADQYSFNSRMETRSQPTEPSTIHRLPQALKILMAVIDEASAIKIAQKPGATLFSATLFTDPDHFDEDVQQLEQELSAHVPRLNYRIFSAEIPIQAAQWNL